MSALITRGLGSVTTLILRGLGLGGTPYVPRVDSPIDGYVGVQTRAARSCTVAAVERLTVRVRVSA